MTNEQFWSELRSLIDPKTTTSVKAISTLFSTATQENLSLLVVLKDGVLQSLSANNLIFAHCVTDWHDPLPSDCTIDEAELSISSITGIVDLPFCRMEHLSGLSGRI